MATFLYVSKPVASLQFDLDTQGSITLDPSVQKQASTNRLPDGKLRVIVFGLNITTFTGRFASVSGAINSISNVVAANADGTVSNAAVSKLSPPKGVKVVVKK